MEKELAELQKSPVADSASKTNTLKNRINYPEELIYKFKTANQSFYAYADGDDIKIYKGGDLNLYDVDTNIKLFEDSHKKIQNVCHDADELAIEIAKQLLPPSNDITYDLYNRGELSSNYHLNKDFEIVTSEETTTLCLYQSDTISARMLNVMPIEEENLAALKEQFEDEDSEGLAEYFWEGEDELYSVFNLWGDEDSDILCYELNGEEGEFVLSESNVFDYGDEPSMFERDDAPDYLLVKSEVNDGETADYTVPKDLDVTKLRFPLYPLFDCDEPDCVGDTVTGFGTLHYAGKALLMGDKENRGSELCCYLLLKKKENNFYEVLARCDGEDY